MRIEVSQKRVSKKSHHAGPWHRTKSWSFMTKNDLGGVPLIFLWGRPAGTDDPHYAGSQLDDPQWLPSANHVRWRWEVPYR